LSYYGSQRLLNTTLKLRRVRIQQDRLSCDGATALKIDASGNLLLKLKAASCAA
jgi:hypothetical protein